MRPMFQAVMWRIRRKGVLYSRCITFSNILTLHKNLQCPTWVIHVHITELNKQPYEVDIAVAWEGLLVFDSLVFILTVLQTCKGRRRHHLISLRRIDIVSLVLRDGASVHGASYFCKTDFEVLFIHRRYLLCVCALQLVDEWFSGW